MRIALGATAMATLLVGCATGPTHTSESAPVPESRVIAKELTTSRPGHAHLVVKRDSGFMAGGCTFRVFASGQALADFRPGEVASFYLQPGELVVGARATGFCGSGDAETAVNLKVGQSKTLRISIDNGGAVRLAPTAF